MSNNGTWLALQSDPNAEERILSLCAQGYSNEQVAEQARLLGILERVTPHDIEFFRKNNVEQITRYAEVAAKEILSKCVRSKKAFRIAELDKLLGEFSKSIPIHLADKPAWAARLMSVYLQGARQLAEETGDLQDVGAGANKWIVIMQNANEEEKKQITEHLIKLEQIARSFKEKELPQPRVIDGEFSIEPVEDKV